ncbi:MAG: hypothetical protein ACKOE6_00475 [Flammeovirgaceae bacterium]
MKNLELHDMKLVELTPEEASAQAGGWFWHAFQAAVAVIGAVIYIYNNADDFVAGWNEGKKEAGY